MPQKPWMIHTVICTSPCLRGYIPWMIMCVPCNTISIVSLYTYTYHVNCRCHRIITIVFLNSFRIIFLITIVTPITINIVCGKCHVHSHYRYRDHCNNRNTNIYTCRCKRRCRFRSHYKYIHLYGCRYLCRYIGTFMCKFRDGYMCRCRCACRCRLPQTSTDELMWAHISSDQFAQISLFAEIMSDQPTQTQRTDIIMVMWVVMTPTDIEWTHVPSIRTSTPGHHGNLLVGWQPSSRAAACGPQSHNINSNSNNKSELAART